VSARPRNRPRRRSPWRRLVLLVPLGAAFLGGIGLGEALHDNPRAGGSQTVVRTLKPLTLPDLTTETGMVTTSNH
jgi:hypothetical protein